MEKKTENGKFVLAVSVSADVTEERIRQINAAVHRVLQWFEKYQEFRSSAEQVTLIFPHFCAPWICCPTRSTGNNIMTADETTGMVGTLMEELRESGDDDLLCWLTDGCVAPQVVTCLREHPDWPRYQNTQRFVLALEENAPVVDLAGNEHFVDYVEEPEKLGEILITVLENRFGSLAYWERRRKSFPPSNVFLSYENKEATATRKALAEEIENADTLWMWQDEKEVREFCPIESAAVGCVRDVSKTKAPKSSFWSRLKKTAPIKLQKVEFSAVVPEKITKGSYAMIEIAIYEQFYRKIVDKMIENAGVPVREVIASGGEIGENTTVRIVLSSPDLELGNCEEIQRWQGKYLVFDFPVEIPRTFAKHQILFTASVYFNDVIATRLKFIVNCSSALEQKLQITRQDVLSAFVSYASEDRGRVAAIIQGMKKARPDMDIFFDVDSLRSGANWKEALLGEIEARDVLYLCWSDYARKSQWVEWEWRYALESKGLEAIEPIPLISPQECPPPEELKSKHFHDRALLYIKD